MNTLSLPEAEVIGGANQLIGDLKDEPQQVSPRNSLNDLTAKEWIPETISVWSQRGLGANHPDARIERLHPAPFSFTDVGRLIKFFTKKGGVVLDPFCGVGSTLKACAMSERRGIGIELNPKYARLAEERLRKEVKADLFQANEQTILTGDARDCVHSLSPDSVDLVVTSPPYWSILHKEDHKARQERTSKSLDSRYSGDIRDLGNIGDYNHFLNELTAILVLCKNTLKPKKHMVIVVSDFRDKSHYYMFHADLARRMEDAGLVLKGITILYQRHKRIFPYGYPTSFVPNIHHQYILILQKEK